MNIKDQQYMLALYERQSLTKAAESLGITQAALSKWLDRIEADLGMRLCIRARSGLELTEAGKLYLDGSKRMIEIRNRTYHQISYLSGKEPVRLRVAGTPAGGAGLFSKLFKPFTTRFPYTTLTFSESYNKEALRLVLEGKADLAIGSLLGASPEGLHTTVIAEKELVILVPEGFPFYYDGSAVKSGDTLPSLSLQELSGIPLVFPSSEVSFHDTLSDLFSEAGTEPDIIYQSSSTKALHDMTAGGNGIGFLSRDMISPEDTVAPYSFSPPLHYHTVVCCREGDEEREDIAFLISLASREGGRA